MNKQKLYFILFLLLGAGISLNASTKRGVIPASGSLEKSGDEIFLSYILTIEHESVSSCRTVYITPQIAGRTETISFPPVIIKGKARNQAYERWLALSGKSLNPEPYAMVTVDSKHDQEVDFSTAVAFEPWMEEAELRFEERVFYCGEEESRSFHRLARLESAPIPEPAPVIVQEEEPMIIPEDSKEKKGIAYISFEQGKSSIRPTYQNNREELRAIADVIRSIEKDETAKVVGLILTGYASPEGSEVTNFRLSRQRTEAVMNYINEEFNLRLPSKQMKIRSHGEDWEGLRELIEEDYIPYKHEVLRIIDSNMNLDEKEHRLRSIANGEVYRILLEDYFPKLRRTKYQILYKM